MQPLVTVITPTTPDRAHFMPRLKEMIQVQTYPYIEHIIDDGAGTVGEKRNRLCERAKGSIIVHMDSDDLYSPIWVAKCVHALLSSGADIVGLSVANFQELDTLQMYRYTYPDSESIHGATMCYYKEHAIMYPFPKIMEGEDNIFCKRKRLYCHGYIDGFTATIHSGNTSKKNVNGERWGLVPSGSNQ